MNKIQIFNTESYRDNRGKLIPIWKKEWAHLDFVEDRLSYSRKGVIRGFHGDNHTWKLCKCIHGALLMVVWDINNSIKTTIRLTENDNILLLIPPNHLNGHQCLSYKCILYYKWTHPYDGPENQWTVKYDDPTINAQWQNIPKIISDRDKNANYL